MNRQSLYRILLILLVILVARGIAMAGEPTAQIKETTDKIIAIVTDPALKGEAHTKERRRLIRQAANERFDWREMARRALARYWARRTEAERKEFVDLFTELLERTYMRRIENYSGEKVYYIGERVRGKYAVVSVKVLTAKETEIPVFYRLRKKDGKWLVYDVSIEGVSLVNNYRVQFNSIILRHSYAGLIKRLKAKVSSQ